MSQNVDSKLLEHTGRVSEPDKTLTKTTSRKVMKNATLICEVKQGYHPPPLVGQEKALLDEFYARYGVKDKGADEKINALKKTIQARSFFAFGGDETKEMELRANERIFLLQHGN